LTRPGTSGGRVPAWGEAVHGEPGLIPYSVAVGDLVTAAGPDRTAAAAITGRSGTCRPRRS
jgi:hypothetical protein